MTFIRILLMFAAVLLVLFWIVIIAAVFFHREIAAVRLARKLGKKGAEFQCKRCGKCCGLNIITDAQTVGNIADTIGRPADEFAKKLPLGWYLLKKGADGACVLRAQEESAGTNCFSCTVYPVRPLACRRFPFLVFPGRIKGIDARCPHLPKKDA